MANNPINLAVRFLLELAALGALAVWGWHAVDGPARYIVALAAPATGAAVWGIFRIPGDPGPAPVATPGPIRLAIEIGLFGLATISSFAAGFNTFAWILGGMVLLHYLVSYYRVAGMLRNRTPPA